MNQLIPMSFDRCRVHAGLTHGDDLRRDFQSSRHERMPLPQFAQPWAQIEAQETRQRHGEVGIAVRVDSQLRHLHPLLSHHPFNGGTSLALIEHNRLGVEDPQRVAHVAVNTDGLSGVVDPGVPAIPGGWSPGSSSDEARSARPHVAARMALRANSSTAWQARASRCSSPAQRMAWRMLGSR